MSFYKYNFIGGFFMHILIIIIIAVSLSMDAFSLSLAYGTLNITKKNIWQLSMIVGIYHFLMPLLGMLVGSLILKYFPISPNILVFVVLVFIGVEMINESRSSDTEVKTMNLKELLLFGLAVSLDSFSVGIGLETISHHYIISALLFSFSSFFFTYLGLILGKRINNKIGSISTLIGGIVLISIGIMYLI